MRASSIVSHVCFAASLKNDGRHIVGDDSVALLFVSRLHACSVLMLFTCRLRTCIAEAQSEAENLKKLASSSSKQMKNLVAAIDMVFGSAAALSATFGHKVEPFIGCPCFPTSNVGLHNKSGKPSLPSPDVTVCRSHLISENWIIFFSFVQCKASLAKCMRLTAIQLPGTAAI